MFVVPVEYIVSEDKIGGAGCQVDWNEGRCNRGRE
jgi:hypothetical protein